MEIHFKNNIKSWLDNLEALQPIPTEFCPNLKTVSPPKAIIFDIYGTLIISASGDIDQATLDSGNMAKALEAGGFKGTTPEQLAQFTLEQLPLKIKSNQQELKDKGFPYPDVDIFKVWREMIQEAQKKDLIQISGKESYCDSVMVFELLSNKVYPMPGMKEVLQALNEKNIPIGIVSNAQFYTPIIMNYLITGEVSTAQDIQLFDPELCVYSYKEFRAKPDLKMFNKIVETLDNKYNLAPSDAIFVGNDMLKDVYTATQNGLRTVLFSGDKRSLRLREDDQRVKGLFPEFFVNELKQLLAIIN